MERRHRAPKLSGSHPGGDVLAAAHRLGPVGDNAAVTSPCPTPSRPPHRPVRRAVRAGPARSRPGGVNSPVRAFNAVGGTPRFIALRARRLAHRRRRQRVRRPDLLLGPDAARPRPPRGAGGRRRGGRPRHVVRHPDRARGRARRGDRRAYAGRAGPLRLLRHRGDDVRDPAGPRLHRPRRRGEVRRLLPRPRRLAAGRGRLRAWPRSPCPAPPASRSPRTALTLVLPYNDRAAVEEAFAEHGDRIACLVTEAAPGNMGVVPPAPGFNQFLAETCTRHGALFVSDEVMTGFRASREGQWGLDGKAEGWRPDLMTFGKVMGGGFPAAAFGGRADVMAPLSPRGPRLPGRHPLGEPGRDHRRAGHAAAGHRRGLRPPAHGRRRDQGRRRGGLHRGRCPARRPVHRHDVLGVLHRHPGHRLRRCQPPGPPGVRRVLPCHARPRGPPPAVGVRGLVPVQRPRRPRGADDPRRPFPQPRRPPPEPEENDERRPPPSTCCATARCTTRRACSTAAATATTSPTAARRWPGWSPRRSRTATSRTWSPPRSSGPRRPRAARRGPGPRDHHRPPGHRVHQRVRGQALRRGRRRAAPARRLAAPVEPVQAVVGRALQAGRRPDDVRASTTPARRPAATRPSWSPTSCRSGSPGWPPRSGRSCTTRASASARCAR